MEAERTCCRACPYEEGTESEKGPGEFKPEEQLQSMPL